VFFDQNFGFQSFETNKDFGDFLVWRSADKCPTYELAVVVDDVVMKINEIVRGCDLLLSTARQLLLMRSILELDFNCMLCYYPLFRNYVFIDNNSDNYHYNNHSDGSNVNDNFENEKKNYYHDCFSKKNLKTIHNNDENKTNNYLFLKKIIKNEKILEIFACEDYRIPNFFHLPLVCDEKGERLAKRNKAKSLKSLKLEGFTPEKIRELFFNF
jgi:glutamyl/glutaminyl-tRNA synthetase